jgi:hypothetical protein
MEHEQQGMAPAMTALVEVLGYYKHQATAFEAQMWSNVIAEVGDEAVVRFLQAHVQRSPFAPKVNEAMAMLRPGANNAAAAFEQLAQAVERVGPYNAPIFKDAALVQAIHGLGGWAQVCEQLPGPGSRFDREAYFKRFEVCYQSGAANVLLEGPKPEPLRGLHAITNENTRLLLDARRQQQALTHQRATSELAHDDALAAERLRG